MDDQYCLLTPNFNLPSDLYRRLVIDIQEKNFRGNFSYFDPEKFKSKSKIVELLKELIFGRVVFKTHQLDTETEAEVINQYRSFIDFVGLPYKIRLKTLSQAKMMPPHSDVANSNKGTTFPKGDYCSIFIGLLTNQEKTNWYSYNGIFNINRINFFKLKKQKSLILKNQQACLFDNNAIHSVTNCNPKNTRWALAISWQDITYEELLQKYNDYINTSGNK